MSPNHTTTLGALLQNAMSTIPPGRWAVAVSGGADSIALLILAVRARPIADWHVVHLDHETRDGQSAADAEFVRTVCHRIGVATTIRRISEIDRPDAPPNRSARFRAARLGLFRLVVERHQLAGVLQAHHAGDQAETVLLRLLRGGPVVGIRPRSIIDGLTILRPLLETTRADLREFLGEIGQSWREDESNLSAAYARNRARSWLRDKPCLAAELVRLGQAGAAVTAWVKEAAPSLPESPRTEMLANIPAILALESARRWLAEQGSIDADSPAGRRLIAMAGDLATPATANFPGNLRVRRRHGQLFGEK